MTKKNLTQEEKDERKIVGLFVGGLGLLLLFNLLVRVSLLVLAGFIVYWNVTDISSNGLTTAWPIVWLFVALALAIAAIRAPRPTSSSS